jgi:formate hydrogenlyase subunit 3/multisubunit Na+/H+ antiporter MnhD subunit
MDLFLFGIGILILSGGCSLFCSSKRWGRTLTTGMAVLGCILSAIPSAHTLITGTPVSFQMAWSGSFGNLTLEIDRLSAFFLVPHFFLSALCSVYAFAYMAPYAATRNVGVPSLFFHALIAAIALVLTAKNSIFFLIVWEMMALSCFFLVVFEEHENTLNAGLTFLIATHIGTAFLLVFFILLGKQCGSARFSDFITLGNLSPQTTTLLFFLSLIGFGTKAGLVPFHVWLPEAHSAAPSPVSALMSAVMIKTGFYGILRSLTFLPNAQPSWGWALLILGLISGVFGIISALAQKDVKRMLAYSSIENIGIIAVAIGIGVLGMSMRMNVLASLGFLGALFHIFNHTLMKGLLFLASGSVIHRAHTRDMNDLGGLFKKMPWTGTSFLIGAIAISGLPPLNGFFSEFWIYLGAFHGILSNTPSLAFASLAAVFGLTLIGALSVATFTKAFGMIFLGHFRGEALYEITEENNAIRWPMAILSILCLLVAPLSVFFLKSMLPIASKLIWDISGLSLEFPLDFMGILTNLAYASVLLPLLVAILAGARSLLLRKRLVKREVTWDCGYAEPSPRMQYTQSSFAQPILALFHAFVHRTQHLHVPTGYFPPHGSSSLSILISDHFQNKIYEPLFSWIDRRLSFFRRFQHGKMQVYILFIALVLIALLFFQLGIGT